MRDAPRASTPASCSTNATTSMACCIRSACAILKKLIFESEIQHWLEARVSEEERRNERPRPRPRAVRGAAGNSGKRDFRMRHLPRRRKRRAFRSASCRMRFRMARRVWSRPSRIGPIGMMAGNVAANPERSAHLRDRVASAVRARIEVLNPHKEAARRAAAFLALPQNAPLAAKLTMRSVDAMWRAAGDRSSDFSYYTKRATLAGVYGATLAYWLQRFQRRQCRDLGLSGPSHRQCDAAREIPAAAAVKAIAKASRPVWTSQVHSAAAR